MSTMTPKHLPQVPTIHELTDAVKRSLENAEKAIAVLSTMLKVAGLKQGFVVADEMLGDIKYALQAMPAIDAHLRREVKVTDAVIEGLNLIAGTDGAECASPRAKAAELLVMLATAPTSVATDGQGGEG